MGGRPLLVILNLGVNQIVNAVSAGACNEQTEEDNQINQRQLSIRHHGIMHIKKGNCHRYDHRNKDNSDQTSGHEKHRAGKFDKDGKHQTHIAAQAEDTRKRI